MRNLRTLSQLWLAVNGHEPFWRVVLASTVTEACTLVDLMYAPSSSGSAHQQLSLLALLERDEPRSAAIPVLRAGWHSLDQAALSHVRDLRNRVGAHVDEKLSVSRITQIMQMSDPNHLNAVLDNCFDTLTEAIRSEPLLRPIMMFDTAMSGFSLAAPPEAERPYQ